MNQAITLERPREKAARMPPLNAMNGIVRDAICRALASLYLLADSGCTVTRVELDRARPVLWLDSAPPTPWIKGSLRRRQTVGGVRMTVRVAQVRECLVQWIERDTIEDL